MPLACALIVLAMVPAASTVQAKPPIAWRTDYTLARQEAAKKKLPLFLYFTFEECVHAARFERATLSDPKIITLLSKSFVCLKVDIAKDPDLAAKFEVEACPDMILIAPSGTRAGRHVGFLDAARFGKMLEGIVAQKQS